MKVSRLIITVVSFLLCISLVRCSCSGDDSENDKAKEVGTNPEKVDNKPSLMDALAANDFETAHKLVAQAEADIQKYNAEKWDSRKDDIREEMIKKYGFGPEAKETVFQKEATFLAVQGTNEANKRLMVLLNEEPMAGAVRSEGQELQRRASYPSIDKVEEYYDKDYGAYIKWCGRYNARCMQILDIAINLENEQLAKMMVKAIKNDPEIMTEKSEGSYNDYDVFAHFTTKTKDEAKSKYEEAFGKQDMTDE